MISFVLQQEKNMNKRKTRNLNQNEMARLFFGDNIKFISEIVKEDKKKKTLKVTK